MSQATLSTSEPAAAGCDVRVIGGGTAAPPLARQQGATLIDGKVHATGNCACGAAWASGARHLMLGDAYACNQVRDVDAVPGENIAADAG